MRLLSLSSWLAAAVLISGAFVVSRSFLREGIQNLNSDIETINKALRKSHGDPPVFAYWISGTGGENRRILRLLKAVYHPRNRYLIHLDAGSTADERTELARAFRSERVFKAFGNVDVMGKSYAVDRTGSSVLAATLHGAAVLLKISKDWDWFITLSSSDYPIVTQDGKNYDL